MTTLQKYIAVGVVVILAILGYTSFSSHKFGSFLQGQVQSDAFLFINGFAAGSSQQFLVDGSGNLTTSGTLTGTGATTLGSLITSTFTQGGGVGTVSTTSTTYTLASTDFDTENVIDVTPGGASLTLTLPASSTLPLSTTAGASRTVWIRNATTTAAINITVAGGLGDYMKSASTTFILMSSTGTSTQARLDFVRRANSDISVMFTPYNN